jgi:hypothetical protein
VTCGFASSGETGPSSSSFRRGIAGERVSTRSLATRGGSECRVTCGFFEFSSWGDSAG